MKFDHQKFFAGYRNAWGALSQPQVDGIESLLTFIEADAAMTDPRWVSYLLATIKHECADTWQPIEEYGKGRLYSYGQPDPVTGQTYYGRGFVQLTFKSNYEKLGEALGLGDALVLNPALALDPATAYQIISYGMRNGSFTGRRLSDYIRDTTCDYFNSRRIINGTDRATLIAGYAQTFERVLNAAMVSDAPDAGA